MENFLRDNMYGRSMVFFENACHNLERYKLGTTSLVDESHFDMACFNAQQALAAILKAVLLEYDISYEKEDDISYLYELILNHTDFRFTKQKDIELLADMITGWEVRRKRYSGIKVEEREVKRALGIYQDISDHFLALTLSNVLSKYGQRNNEDDIKDLE